MALRFDVFRDVAQPRQGLLPYARHIIVDVKKTVAYRKPDNVHTALVEPTVGSAIRMKSIRSGQDRRIHATGWRAYETTF